MEIGRAGKKKNEKKSPDMVQPGPPSPRGRYSPKQQMNYLTSLPTTNNPSTTPWEGGRKKIEIYIYSARCVLENYFFMFLRYSCGICNTLRHPTTPCNTQQHPATSINTQQHPATPSNIHQHPLTPCYTLQHPATPSNIQ